MSAIETLKNRLAKGEISISEYKQIIQGLAPSHNSENLSNSLELLKRGASKLISTSSDAYTNIVGKDSVPYPTNHSPLEVTKVFKIYGDFLEYNSERYPFSEIVSISFHAKSETINFVPMGTDSNLGLVLRNGKKIDLSGKSVFIKGKTNKLLSIAHSLLSEITFNQRLKIAIDNLNGRGGIVIDGVTITRDGFFRKGSTSINIKKSSANDNLVIGTYSSFGVRYSNYDPYEVVAGETGTSILSSRVRFSVKSDTDVIFHLIRKLAE